MNRGTWYALGAYTVWGVLPIFWKWLQHLPALEIVAHRMVWSFVFLALLLTVRQEWQALWRAARRRRVVLAFLGTATLLTANWLVYVWAVNAGHIVETSLGYFVNPLVNVLLGVIFLRERLRAGQWAAIAVAAAGVLYLTVSYGALPWIALALAFTFGFYGLLKKATPLTSLQGLALETSVLFVPTVLYLGVLGWTGAGSFGAGSWRTDLLLILAGLVTTGPLLLFAAGARRVPLSMMGVLQYIAPTLQFLIGVLLYHEPFTPARLVGFCLIWLALLIYSVEGVMAHRRPAPAAGSA